jgi:SAM-dependent methyltransferase
LNLIERVHERYIKNRRVNVLASRLAPLLPRGARVLDVGSGDGRIAEEIMLLRRDVAFTGVDVLVRTDARIPVIAFDGTRLPFDDAAFDVVLFVDVLHHTEDPGALLREAHRVGRRAVIVKDHDATGFLAVPTLRWMDRVGNARFAVALPHNYLEWRRWTVEFQRLGYTVESVLRRLNIYPVPLRWAFDRSLHFVAVLGISAAR